MKQIKTTIALLFLAGSLFSQTHNEQVTVIARYQPTLMGEAFKINVSPETIDSVLRPREMRFDIFSRKVVTTFGTENIRPARVAGEPLSKLSPLYIRGGFGNYNTGYGELFYGSGRSKQWEYGAHLKHRSSQGKFKNHDVPFDNSINRINLFGGYHGKNVLLSADFYYDRQRFSAYGADTLFLHYDHIYRDTIFMKNKHYKLVYNNIGGNIGFSDNNTKPNSFGYSGNLNINYFHSVFSDIGNNEFSLYFTGNIHQTFDLRHPIFNQTILGLDVAADWHNVNLNPRMLKFHPHGKLRFSGHDFSLGLRVNTFGEPDYSARKIKAAAQWVPTVHAKFNLIDNLFAIEFGMDGDAQYMTSKKITQANPFAPWEIFSIFDDPQFHREYYLGLNTQLSKTFDFAMKGKITQYKNLLNYDAPTWFFYGFISPPWWSHVSPFFGRTYQDINLFQLQADLNYHLNERISVSTMFRFNHFDDEILYKPKYEANLTARYNIQDKIILKTQLYFNAETYYRIPFYWVPWSSYYPGTGTPPLEKFKPVVDWSLGAEYRFNRRWSAFLEFNNILNQRYYHWHNYRSFGTNFLLGATFNL